MRRLTRRLLTAAGLLLLAVIHMPQALAFPYQARFGADIVYSTAPIPPAMAAILARSDALDRASPLAPVPPRRIFLTDGGWRWRLLTLTAHGAFALTRPLSEAIVVNRSDVAADAVWNGASVGGRRTLAGVVAHEAAHVMIRQRYGLRSVLFPTWKIEGYADHVAQESGLSDADAARLARAGQSTPGLFYYRARRRVEAALAAGTSVDALFGQS